MVEKNCRWQCHACVCYHHCHSTEYTADIYNHLQGHVCLCLHSCKHHWLSHNYHHSQLLRIFHTLQCCPQIHLSVTQLLMLLCACMAAMQKKRLVNFSGMGSTSYTWVGITPSRLATKTAMHALAAHCCSSLLHDHIQHIYCCPCWHYGHTHSAYCCTTTYQSGQMYPVAVYALLLGTTHMLISDASWCYLRYTGRTDMTTSAGGQDEA